MEGENRTSFIPSKHGFHFRNSFSIAPVFLRPIFPKIGFCGGMCWAALDRYYGGEPIPGATTTPLPGSALYKELFWRQMDTTPSWRWFQAIAWQNTSDKKLAALTQKEWPKVKASIDNGIPITMCLIQSLPIIGLPTYNHQAIAVGYRVDPTSALRPVYLTIYDPNRPSQDAATLYMTEQGPNDSWKTHVPNTDDSKKLRGFFVIPYESKP
ncbi:MAG: hypothetical protein JW918_13340 [Anaerolineae bacterium]|nr:hypothetical protein [Anaerolineae bacterium]